MDTDTLELCRQTAEAVLENMFFETLVDEPKPCASVPQDALQAEARFSGSEHGSLQVSAEPVVARRLASNFLGEEETDVSDQQIRSTLCELANIYCGCLLSQVRPEGRLRISSPEMVARFSIEREWIQLPVETGLLAVSLRWEGRPE